jgi:acyl transferase domain-containing protein/thioesterase domain-containing protein
MIKQPIAIVGMGCRFPGANNPSEFWEILQNGVHKITKDPIDRPTQMTGWAGFLDGIDKFDAAFFGISSEEAIKMDPQHRLLLETSWEALEDAGLVPANLAGTDTGVFIGLSGSEYPNLLIEDSTFNTTIGTLDCMLANRISSYFDFQGLSITINTACSSVLVAIDSACQSLWNEDICLALVGGTHLTFSPVIASRYVNAGLISADGLCKTFDAKADGYVRGECIGVVVLKLLSQAQADGDRIYAVIRGSGVNHNGSGNGLTAPNMQAQIALLQKVYQRAEINPNSINYIEANGTATPIGDALEMKALGTVVGKDRTADNPCRVGSVKTNIGHTEGASGIAGLIKVALSLYHRQIPPTLHCQEPNPAIPFAKLGLKVQQTLETLPEETGPIRAGVSSFSLGGTNAHLILESVPSQAKAEPNLSPLQVFTLTAKTSTALQALVQRYQSFLEDNPEVALSDICFMANTRRSQFSHRLAMITESKEQLQEQLNMIVRQEALSSVFSGQVIRQKSAPICFIFSGKSQKLKLIIKSLAQSHPAIYSLLEELQPLISSYSTRSFFQLIEEENLENPFLSQVVNFICEYAMTQLWQYWGIKPAICIGYGLGNYAALVLAGILTVEEAISLIIEDKKIESPPKFQAAKIPVILPLSGKTIKIHETIDYKQWQKEFNINNMNAENLPSLLSDSNVILLDLCSLEIKSHEHLKQLDNYNTKSPEEIKSSDHLYCLFSTLIKFWLMGVKIDWSKVANYQQCYPISVPTYPFEGQSYWIDVSPKIPNKQSIHNQENYLNVEFIAPRDNLEMQLTEIWQEVLGIQTIGVKDNFFNLGGRSLLGVKLFAQIEKAFDKKLPLTTLFQAPTVEQLAKVLRHQGGTSPWYSLVPIQPGGSRPPLFGIHHVYFRDLVRYLGQEQPVYALHYGMAEPTDRALSLPKIEDLAAHYIQEMRTLQPEGPYFLMGLSFGGLVAYEMAQQLVAQGQQVAFLALFDSYIEVRGKLLPLPQRLSNLLRLSPAEWLERIKKRMEMKLIRLRYGDQYLPHIYNPDPITQISKAYTPKAYSGRVTFFKAMDKFSVSYSIESPEEGWRKFVDGELEIYEIPGSHIGILEEPNVQVLAEKLKVCIDKALTC